MRFPMCGQKLSEAATNIVATMHRFSQNRLGFAENNKLGLPPQTP